MRGPPAAMPAGLRPLHDLGRESTEPSTPAMARLSSRPERSLKASQGAHGAFRARLVWVAAEPTRKLALSSAWTASLEGPEACVAAGRAMATSSPFALPDHQATQDGLEPVRWPERSLHVVLATTGSVASVKAPLIVAELLKVCQSLL